MDVTQPEADFVGFAIEVQGPGSPDFIHLRNRLNFSYAQPAAAAVNGYRNYLSTEARDPRRGTHAQANTNRLRTH